MALALWGDVCVGFVVYVVDLQLSQSISSTFFFPRIRVVLWIDGLRLIQKVYVVVSVVVLLLRALW